VDDFDFFHFKTLDDQEPPGPLQQSWNKFDTYRFSDKTLADISWGDLLEDSEEIFSKLFSFSIDDLIDLLRRHNHFNLIKGTAEADILSGETGDDYILGFSGGDTLLGLGGNDRLRGGEGDDEISGGEGNDRLHGGSGNDGMTGGVGDDRYFVDDSGDVVVEAIDGGTDTVKSLVSHSLGDYTENLCLTGAAAIDGFGNSLDNRIAGNQADNQIAGGDGGDVLRGYNGSDSLNGGLGNDALYGGRGDDQLLGGAGLDVLVGGVGIDKFIFLAVSDSVVGASRDVVLDFSVETDLIDLEAIDANTLLANDQAFTYINSLEFSQSAGQLRFDTETHILSGDTNGDGMADFEVSLLNVDILTSSVFAL
jgi:Ca2+-binding RTX toxin-like protein